MIRLGMVYDQIIDGPVADLLADLSEVFLLESFIYCIYQCNFLVNNEI